MRLKNALESEDDALTILVERIKRGKCVLVLGPRVAVRADDSARTPLDELLAFELSKKLKLTDERNPFVRVCWLLIGVLGLPVPENRIYSCSVSNFRAFIE